VDQNHFDSLVRLVAGGLDSRRSFMGLLASGMISSVGAHIGLAEVVAAKKTHHKRKHDRGRKEAHTEGKHSKKHQQHGNKQRKKRKQEEFPLCSFTCETDGGRCCPGGICVDAKTCCDGTPPCPDGSCPVAGECCEGLWMCPGEVCHPVDECCPGTRRCGPTTCIKNDQCCDGDTHCPGGSCVPPGSCCRGQKRCGQSCISLEECCPDEPPPACAPGSGEHPYCCHGEMVCRLIPDQQTCSRYPWLLYDAEDCNCHCPSGTIQSHGYCCPPDHPVTKGGNHCFKDNVDPNDWVCPLGFHLCQLNGYAACCIGAPS
jgi:hypothetical protein